MHGISPAHFIQFPVCIPDAVPIVDIVDETTVPYKWYGGGGILGYLNQFPKMVPSNRMRVTEPQKIEIERIGQTTIRKPFHANEMVIRLNGLIDGNDGGGGAT